MLDNSAYDAFYLGILKEISEEKIKDTVENIVSSGMNSENLQNVLLMGEQYKKHNLTPLYLTDKDFTYVGVFSKETFNRKAIH